MNHMFQEFIGTNALEMDLVNIAPLDDLHYPTGPIKQSQELAALAFGDTAQQDLVLHGTERVGRAIQPANQVRDEVNCIPGLMSMDNRVLQDNATYQFDPTKRTVSVKGLGIRGREF